MTLYLVDNSVFQRLPQQPQVADALRAFATYLPITLDAGHSVVSDEQYAQVMELINALRRLPITADVQALAVTLQASLGRGGLVRAVGVNDLVIAATAIVYGAVVLHYDADYEHIVEVSELNQIWVVPRGSTA
ncbi:MAG: PIN domain-containing protein [Pseudonocardiales bacterium]